MKQTRQNDKKPQIWAKFDLLATSLSVCGSPKTRKEIKPCDGKKPVRDFDKDEI